MPGVKPDALPVARTAHAPLEEVSVCIELEEIGAVSQVGGSLILAAEVEGYALGLHVGYLLLDGQQELGVPFGVGVDGLFDVFHAGASPPFLVTILPARCNASLLSPTCSH